MLRARSETTGDLSSIDTPQDDDSRETLLQSIKGFFLEEGPWWGCSFAFHVVLLSAVALLGGMIPNAPFSPEVEFSGAIPDVAESAEEIDRTKFVIPDEPVKPEKPEVVNFDKIDFKTIAETGFESSNVGNGDVPRGNDCADALPVTQRKEMFAGQSGMSVWGVGPGPGRIQGASHLVGDGKGHGNGLDFYSQRGRGGPPGTYLPVCEKRVAAALNWLARHQLPDGSWSLQGYATRCRDTTCSGPGAAQADAAATAMAVLPFLATGKTHKTKGLYQKTITDGLAWLIHHQKSDGDLRGGSTMYAHGLATIALCEAYGMTGDHPIGAAAQLAVNFLQAAQNKRTGGWRYQPGDEGDLSVAGWQIMALKSAQMAGLKVDGGAFQKAHDYLLATSAGQGGSGASSAGRGLFAYQPGGLPNRTMTSVGLLCSQYLGAVRDDPTMCDGTAYLMANLPEAPRRDLYYWYYATQVMHNQPGPEWDSWNRKIRELLVESQQREGCAAGSWDPQRPTPDPWGSQGGRLMMTSLATLTLEVYYRYIPLYKLEPGRAGEGTQKKP